MWLLSHKHFPTFYSFFLSEFSFTGHRGRGGITLLFSTTSARSGTFGHLFASLDVRWLPHIFNHSACFYQTAARWELQPYWIIIWYIYDGMLISVCLPDDFLLGFFLLQQFDIGNWLIWTRIDYHPCVTSEPTNQFNYIHLLHQYFDNIAFQ